MNIYNILFLDKSNFSHFKIKGGFRAGVGRDGYLSWPGSKGLQRGGGGAKISITKFAVNVHHYKYSIFKEEIRRKLNWLNTNKNIRI